MLCKCINIGHVYAACMSPALNGNSEIGDIGQSICRYIFTMLSPLARLAFPPDDVHQLTTLYEDNLRIEPEWYCPILPMVLVNGCDGIGTGYSTCVPNYNPREIIANLKRMTAGMEPTEMVCDSMYIVLIIYLA